jgi:hypothetical protein
MRDKAYGSQAREKEFRRVISLTTAPEPSRLDKRSLVSTMRPEDLVLVANTSSRQAAEHKLSLLLLSPGKLLLKELQTKLGMRRVRSRQRFCANDAFDAVSVVSDASEDELPRKHDKELAMRSKNSESSACLLTCLPDDVTFHVCSFLSSRDAHAWRRTNRFYQATLSDPYLWTSYIEKQWPFLGDCFHKKFVNQLNAHYPSHAVSISEVARLLQLACHQQCTGIDESTFGYTRLLRPRQVRHRIDIARSASDNEPVLKTRALVDGSKGVYEY